eukprot:6182215-Pleurochrysis_carterae.AAC.2
MSKRARTHAAKPVSMRSYDESQRVSVRPGADSLANALEQHTCVRGSERMQTRARPIANSYECLSVPLCLCA